MRIKSFRRFELPGGGYSKTIEVLPYGSTVWRTISLYRWRLGDGPSPGLWITIRYS